MNKFQELWWRQAQSDHAAFVLLRQKRAAPCHLLHYLQMATEKLGKAYFWGSGKPPAKSHVCFVKFMQDLGRVPRSDRQRLAAVFEFKRFEGFQNSIRKVMPWAYELQRLAPALAGDGPNPEYPWPPTAPQYAPATFEFDVWVQLDDTGLGRHFMWMIRVAIDKFPEYA